MKKTFIVWTPCKCGYGCMASYHPISRCTTTLAQLQRAFKRYQLRFAECANDDGSMDVFVERPL